MPGRLVRTSRVQLTGSVVGKEEHSGTGLFVGGADPLEHDHLLGLLLQVGVISELLVLVGARDRHVSTRIGEEKAERNSLSDTWRQTVDLYCS